VPLLRSGCCEYKILYNGEMAETLADFAPYLVSLLPGTPLLEKLVEQGWGQSWGYYLASTVGFKAIRQHFRRLLSVRMPNGKQVLFRFYDPRVLRAFLPTAISAEVDQFLGSTTAFYLEAEDRKKLLTYTRAGEMPHKTELVRQSTVLMEEETKC